MNRPGVAATIGVFDGVHRGHAALVGATLLKAAQIEGDAVAFTFDPHPARILAHDQLAPPLLMPPPERECRLLGLGLNRVRFLRFDRAMADLEPRDFIARHIQSGESVRHLVIGHDFALGKGRSGTPERLGAIGVDLGFQVTVVPAVLHEGEPVSSTRIRRAIAEADFDLARELLGHPFQVSGRVVRGDARGRVLGFPTANLPVPGELMMPPFGVYAGRVEIGRLDAVAAPGHEGNASPPSGYPAVMNFGVRPTFGGGHPVLEVHLIGFGGELLGADLRVSIAGRIRREMKFEGPDALVDRIRLDIQAATALLGSLPEGDGEAT